MSLTGRPERFRHSLVPPIPELAVAAEMLGEAAAAVLEGNSERARQKLADADLQCLFDYSHALMGRRDRSVFRKRLVQPTRMSVARIPVRMPAGGVIRSIYARDGWRCRFCNCRVVQKEARDRMRALLPGAIRWDAAEGYHGAFYALTATPDHILPHSRGGTNELDNLVTACWPCNFGRENDLLEELGIADPRSRPPVVDNWSGLTSILGDMPLKQAPAVGPAVSARLGSAGRTVAPPASPSNWASEVDRLAPGLSRQLTSFAESCASAGISSAVNKVLLIRLRVAGGAIAPIGIDPKLGVLIPWSIGDHKEASRPFAESCAAAIPGAIAYETPRTWSVRKLGSRGKLENASVFELLAASDQVRIALQRFAEALDDNRSV